MSQLSIHQKFLISQIIICRIRLEVANGRCRASTSKTQKYSENYESGLTTCRFPRLPPPSRQGSTPEPVPLSGSFHRRALLRR